MDSDESRGVLPTASGPLYWLTLSRNDIGADDDAAAWLTSGELVHWRGLRTDKRRADWLLGRRAAKRLIMGVVEQETGHLLSPNQIAVLPHADGWPIVTVPGGPMLTLSLSHTQNRAFCAVMVGDGRPLGADVEAIAERSPAFIEDYFTPLEQQFLAAAPAEQRVALVNAIWSGKEAALKAIRRGLAEDTRLVSCLPHPVLDAGAEWLPMRIGWTKERASASLPPLAGLWRSAGDCVLTLAFAAIN